VGQASSTSDLQREERVREGARLYSGRLTAIITAEVFNLYGSTGAPVINRFLMNIL
jgi:hypothetical protein